MNKKYYEVEKIVDKRRLPNGKTLYYVQWVGYSSKENTWESVSNLSNVKEMIDEFEKNYTEKKKNSDWKIGTIENDIPKYVIGTEIVEGKLYMNIRWKKRRTNVQPDNSLILYSELKEKYPYVVLEFFESNLTMDNKELEYNSEKNEFKVIEEK